MTNWDLGFWIWDLGKKQKVNLCALCVLYGSNFFWIWDGILTFDSWLFKFFFIILHFDI